MTQQILIAFNRFQLGIKIERGKIRWHKECRFLLFLSLDDVKHRPQFIHPLAQIEINRRPIRSSLFLY